MPKFLHHLPRNAQQFIDDFHHMHGHANGARLVGDRAGHGLANPPGGVGGELIPAAILKFIHGLHQAHIAFLDQVEKLQAAVRVFLGDRDHETQIGFHQFAFGVLRVHVALDHFKPRAPQLMKCSAGFFLELFQVLQTAPLLTLVLRASAVTPGTGTFLLQYLDLAVNGVHCVSRSGNNIDETLALRVRIPQTADDPGNQHFLAGNFPQSAAMSLGVLVAVNAAKFVFKFSQRRAMCRHLANLADRGIPAGRSNIVGHFFFVENHNLFDGTVSTLEVRANRHYFAHHKGRA